MGGSFGRSLLNVATLGLAGGASSDSGLSDAIEAQTRAMQQATEKQIQAQQEAQRRAEQATADAQVQSEQANAKAQSAVANASENVRENKNKADLTQGQAVRPNINKINLGGSAPLGTTDEDQEDWYRL